MIYQACIVEFFCQKRTHESVDPQMGGDVFELDISSLIDITPRLNEVTSVFVTLRRQLPDPGRRTFFTIWATDVVGEQVAKNRSLKQIWHC